MLCSQDKKKGCCYRFYHFKPIQCERLRLEILYSVNKSNEKIKTTIFESISQYLRVDSTRVVYLICGPEPIDSKYYTLDLQ